MRNRFVLEAGDIVFENDLDIQFTVGDATVKQALVKFDEDEARDEHGRWVAGVGGQGPGALDEPTQGAEAVPAEPSKVRPMQVPAAGREHIAQAPIHVPEPRAGVGGVGPGALDEPTQGQIPQPKGPLGGSYEKVKAGTKGIGEYWEVHHMPAQSNISPMHPRNGPAIAMLAEDHWQTKSYGSTDKGIEHCRRQTELIQQGKFREAMQMDIDDIHEKFGSKYDKAIDEAVKYHDSLKYSKRTGMPLNPTPKMRGIGGKRK